MVNPPQRAMEDAIGSAGVGTIVGAIVGEFDYSVSAEHPAFPGHFPQQPIVPGVLLLDQALHGITLALGWPEAPCRIETCKFLSPVKPEETLRIAYRCQPNGSVLFEIDARVAHDENTGRRIVASGKLAAPAPIS
jgi:3-hydroxymyristoyl/3-hydroxydecanoyl-(acyl carrier protein) dehydratase